MQHRSKKIKKSFFIILIVLNLGMNPSDLKLFTALTSAVLLSFPVLKKRFLGGIKNAKN